MTAPDVPTKSGPARRILKVVLALAVLAGAGAAGWSFYGRGAWEEYKAMEAAQRAAEDNVPIGYVGVNYRRSYNNRPIKFTEEKDGRTLLIAVMGDEGKATDHYDLTGVDLDPVALGGGFGRDSIPGIDYPVFEPPSGPHGQNFRDRMPILGATLSDGDRVYPRELLLKIEVVNDRDGDKPFVLVFDRSRDRARAYERTVDSAEVTFGTTGYALKGCPLLYDRASKSLWMPGDDGLVGISGAAKGKRLAEAVPLMETTWGEWRGQHPDSALLVGNDREKPIPEK